MQDATDLDAIPRLDAAAVRLFGRALAEGRLERAGAVRESGELSPDEFDTACEILVRLRLLRCLPARPDVLVPVSPETAAASVVAPLEAKIARVGEQVRSVRGELAALMPQYRAARRGREDQDAVEVIPDAQAAAAVIAEEAARCTLEIFAVGLDTLTPGQAVDGLARDLAALGRGVRMRTLSRLADGAGAAVRDRIRVLAAAGAEYRTVQELPGAAVVFDRSVAFVPGPAPDGAGAATLLIRDRGAVGYLCQLFDQVWASGGPFRAAACDVSDRQASRWAGADVRRAVVSMLAEGAKDETIARRLGVSLRTCRRYIAEILDGLQADSRFQGGVLAERAGLTGPGLADWPG